MSRDLGSLLDIHRAAAEAMDLAQGVSQEGFLQDRKLKWAIYSQFIIIGEAAGRVSAKFRAEHSEVPWSQMVGMRHRLVHGYDQVNWVRVWETLAEDLPAVASVIRSLLPTDEG